MRSRLLIFFVFLTALAGPGCSDTEKTEAEPGSIQAQTEAIGHEAATILKTPMENASNAADKENLRTQQLEERLNTIE